MIQNTVKQHLNNNKICFIILSDNISNYRKGRKTMKKLLAISLAALISVGAIGCSKKESAATVDVPVMTGQEVVELMGSADAADAVVIDVRKADEFAAGHIDGAINVTLEDIQADVNVLDQYKDKKIVLYCNSGNRSGQAAALLLENGYTDVFNADGVKKYEYALVSDIVEVKAMSGQELLDALANRADSVVVVDVRKAEEFAAGHIDGAINVTLEDIQADANVLEQYKDKEVILYCNSGNRSGQAGDILVANGYSVVYNADGVKKFSYDLVTE